MSAKPFLARIMEDRLGATTVEYAMICAFIILVMLGGLSRFSEANLMTWMTVSSRTMESVNSSTS